MCWCGFCFFFLPSPLQIDTKWIVEIPAPPQELCGEWIFFFPLTYDRELIVGEQLKAECRLYIDFSEVVHVSSSTLCFHCKYIKNKTPPSAAFLITQHVSWACDRVNGHWSCESWAEPPPCGVQWVCQPANPQHLFMRPGEARRYIRNMLLLMCVELIKSLVPA